MNGGDDTWRDALDVTAHEALALLEAQWRRDLLCVVDWLRRA